jgi:hypothetical protein
MRAVRSEAKLAALECGPPPTPHRALTTLAPPPAPAKKTHLLARPPPPLAAAAPRLPPLLVPPKVQLPLQLRQLSVFEVGEVVGARGEALQLVEAAAAVGEGGGACGWVGSGGVRQGYGSLDWAEGVSVGDPFSCTEPSSNRRLNDTAPLHAPPARRAPRPPPPP